MSMASRNVDRSMGYSAGRRGRRLAGSSTGFRLPEVCGTFVSVAPKTLNSDAPGPSFVSGRFGELPVRIDDVFVCDAGVE
jgi:hypothetical protein